MNAIAFDGMDQREATFLREEEVTEGQVVKVTENGIVGPCQAGEAFCGVALTVRGAAAGVMLRGFARVSYSGTAPALGWVTLAADGKGGVQAAEAGVSLRVVEADPSNLTAVIYL